MNYFYFIRHGQSKANAEHKIGSSQSPLTELGTTQAKQAAKTIKDLGITKILHSPYIRASKTAQIIAGELNIKNDKLVSIDDLRERDFGSLEGKPKEHDSEWYFMVDYSSLKMESREQLIIRVQNALNKIRQQVESGEKVLVVGHATAGYYLQQIAKGKTKFKDFDPPVECNNAQVVKIDLKI